MDYGCRASCARLSARSKGVSDCGVHSHDDSVPHQRPAPVPNRTRVGCRRISPDRLGRLCSPLLGTILRGALPQAVRQRPDWNAAPHSTNCDVERANVNYPRTCPAWVPCLGLARPRLASPRTSCGSEFPTLAAEPIPASSRNCLWRPARLCQTGIVGHLEHDRTSIPLA